MCFLTDILLSVLHSFSMIFAIFVTVLAAVIGLKLLCSSMCSKKHKTPSAYEEQWFGKLLLTTVQNPAPSPSDSAEVSSEDVSIRPFKIAVSDEVLKDLKSRLENTRFEEPVEDSKFQYGFNSNYLKKVVDYWKKDYDWRKHEEMLNQFPQFKTRIEGLDVHFMHIKPKIPEGSELKVIPLMLIHGWPGSVVEFHKIIPLLTSPRSEHDYVFEVICPSIPGYGFSESPHRKGFSVKAAARVFVTLMERLGHDKFYVQGGDWGSVISSIISRYYPSKILGMHVNACFSNMTPWEGIKYVVIAFFPFLISKEEYKMAYPIKRILKLAYQEFGYFHLQNTKPDTLGCAMASSPAGVAAYILEKFSTGFHGDNLDLPDGGLDEKFTMDELLTNIMLYWVNNNFTAAARFYKENTECLVSAGDSRMPVRVPSAVAVFPNEILMYPRTCMSDQMKNIVSYTRMPRGGHFAALEEPELLADDVWKFVSMVEKQ